MKDPKILRNKEDFNRLFKKGKSVPSRCVVILHTENGLPYSRRAFLASKKVGNSVQRHRAVRLMRESFRQIVSEHALQEGKDFLFIARSTIKDLKCADVKKSIEAAMKREGCI